jgi:hypothetical protein
MPTYILCLFKKNQVYLIIDRWDRGGNEIPPILKDLKGQSFAMDVGHILGIEMNGFKVDVCVGMKNR